MNRTLEQIRQTVFRTPRERDQQQRENIWEDMLVEFSQVDINLANIDRFIELSNRENFHRCNTFLRWSYRILQEAIEILHEEGLTTERNHVKRIVSAVTGGESDGVGDEIDGIEEETRMEALQRLYEKTLETVEHQSVIRGLRVRRVEKLEELKEMVGHLRNLETSSPDQLKNNRVIASTVEQKLKDLKNIDAKLFKYDTEDPEITMGQEDLEDIDTIEDLAERIYEALSRLDPSPVMIFGVPLEARRVLIRYSPELIANMQIVIGSLDRIELSEARGDDVCVSGTQISESERGRSMRSYHDMCDDLDGNDPSASHRCQYPDPGFIGERLTKISYEIARRIPASELIIKQLTPDFIRSSMQRTRDPKFRKLT